MRKKVGRGREKFIQIGVNQKYCCGHQKYLNGKIEVVFIWYFEIIYFCNNLFQMFYYVSFVFIIKNAYIYFKLIYWLRYNKYILYFIAMRMHCGFYYKLN